MTKNSTLIYFVNNFQDDLESTILRPAKNHKKSSLKGTEETPQPSDETIKSILNFARSYDVMETEETGYVEMILN